MSNFVSRVLVTVVGVPVVLYFVYLGDWWLFGLAAFAVVIALHELYVMARSLRPLVLAGYFGTRNLNDLVKSGLLEKDRIALVGYRTSEIRTETPLIYNVRASLRDEINKLTEHLATIVAMVECGFGVAALPETAAQAVAHPGIAERPLVAPVAERSIGLVTLRSRSLSPAAAALVEMLRASLS